MIGDAERGTMRLLERLARVKSNGDRRWQASCPCPEHGKGNGDRNPSLTVTEGDRWPLLRCHAGCEPEDIVAAIGLTWRDLAPDDDRTGSPPPNPRPVTTTSASVTEATPSALPDPQQIEDRHRDLMLNAQLLDRLTELRGWSHQAIENHRLGFDGIRIVFPVYDGGGELVGVQRYEPDPAKRNGVEKTIAVKGSKRDLFPAPESVEGDEIWVVEGEPDAVAGSTLGLPAVAVAGVESWRPEYAPRFAGRRVVFVPDCDESGRKLAERAVIASV